MSVLVLNVCVPVAKASLVLDSLFTLICEKKELLYEREPYPV